MSELSPTKSLWILALAVGCASVSPDVRAQDAPDVSVTIGVDGKSCTITADPETVTLSKQPDKPNHSGSWTWVGAQHGYTKLYFVLKQNDSGLGLCLPSVALPDMASRSGLRGFVITTQGSDSGAVSPLDECVAGTYDYDLIATKPSGEACVVDPRVKIDG